eukprot:CAMPEP_0176495304 /NCGR_PEP_ID=MMETSP0200_2-20121128/10576_1 /TAXON_ID=947934 /ORGANISM="Chaetoceros sp., Strain GSL56" /LENGTH=509 /DNA_ID=CAMNT_0017893155 /DNA_START=344 /DNA_END=1873 /DNA_ORIENTATION=-
MTDVTNEIVRLKSELLFQANEIQDLHEMIRLELNTTVKALNDSVFQVQQSLKKEVQVVNDNVNSQNSLMAYQFAGTFAILGSLISFWHMAAHIRKFNEPSVQTKILAILWMVPIYSVSSWLGLVFVSAQAYLSVLKDIYEAYAIYQFLAFLIAILGRGDREAVITLLAKHADHLKSPLRFKFWAKRDPYPSSRHKAEAVLDQCQMFTMQFVLLRPITTIVMVISDAVHESRWDPKYPQFYTMMVVNISIFFAFTGLVRFYHVVKSDLKWCNPFSKFLCIKGVVFMTFWQGIVISFVAHAVYKKRDDINDDYDSTEWSKRAQSFLICLEMFLFAIVHCFVFPTEEWEPGYQERAKRRIKAKLGDALALRDFVRDVKLVLRSKKNRKGNMERLPQREEGLDDGYGMNGNEEDEIDIDWTKGWSRIEKYLEFVEENGSKSSSDDGDDNHFELRNRNDVPLETMYGEIRIEHLCDDTHDLVLSVEQGTTQTNQRHEGDTGIDDSGQHRPHEFV